MLNSGLIAAGIGLLKIAEGSILASMFLTLFFLLIIGISVFGLETVAVGKAYYREAVFTKTLVEQELGLLVLIPGMQDPRANLSIAVTQGQRKYKTILSGEARDAELAETRISWGTIAFYTQMVFWAMILIEALAAIASVVNAAIIAKS